MKKKKIFIFAVTLLILLIFCYWQNNMLQVSDYTYSNPKISSELDGFKIVQISDLHNKRFGKNQKRLLKKTKSLSPDIIVITGDLVDSNHTNIHKAAEYVKGAAEIAPVYYITGNHEYWLSDTDFNTLMSELKTAGVTVLDDCSVIVEKGSSSFILSGLNDETLITDFQKLLPSDTEKLNILLAHEPQYLDQYSSGSVDLVLTGHAHGGQFVLPFIGGIIAPDQGFFPEYTDGIHKSGDTAMIISRGLGNSVIPVKLFNFPDIVCVTLTV